MSLPNSRKYYTAIYLVTILKTAQEVTSITTFSQTLLAFVAGLGVPFRAPKSNEVYEWQLGVVYVVAAAELNTMQFAGNVL